MTRAEKVQLGADLSAFLDGELSPERTREIEELLTQSAEARDLLEQLRGVAQRLGALPRVNAPDGRVAEMLRQYEKTRDSNATPRPPCVHALWRISRVLASAAVIALCFYTGWFMHAHYVPPQFGAERSASSADHTRETIDQLMETDKEKPASPLAVAEKVALPPEAVPEIPREVVNALESLGYVGGDEDYNQDGVQDLAAKPLPDAPEPRQPAADPITRKEVASGEWAMTIQPDDSYSTAAQPIASATAAPTIQVFVTPQDGEQYAAALQAVASWQGMERRAGVSIMPAVADSSGKSDAIFARQVTVQIPPEGVSGLLSELERLVPRQVNVALNFRPEALTQVQEIVSPAPLATIAARRIGDELRDAPAVTEAAPPPPAAAMRPATEQPKALAARVYELEKQDDARNASSQQLPNSPESKQKSEADVAGQKKPRFRAHPNMRESNPDRDASAAADGRPARGGRPAGRTAKKYAPDRQPTVADVARSASEKLVGQPLDLARAERENPASSPTPATMAAGGLAGGASSASSPASAPVDSSMTTQSAEHPDAAALGELFYVDAHEHGEPSADGSEAPSVTISINILPPPADSQPTTRPR